MKTNSVARLVLCCLAGLLVPAMGQKLIPVETENNSLVLLVNNANEVMQKYYGDRLQSPGDFLQAPFSDSKREATFEAYSTFGKHNPFEVALQATHADGNMTTDLRYQSRRSDRAPATR